MKSNTPQWSNPSPIKEKGMKIRKEIEHFYDVIKRPDGSQVFIMKKLPWEAIMEAQLKGYSLTKNEKKKC